MFIDRLPDGSIYGCWSVRQWPKQEELPDTDGELIAFIASTDPPAISQRDSDLTDAQVKIDAALAAADIADPVKEALAAIKKVLR